MAKSRELPFTAIPVFPRRLFSLSQMWVNVEAGINSPQDLIGRKVGLHSFQNTLATLSKGDLQTEYNVPWRRIHWMLSKEETIPFKPAAGIKLELIPPHEDIGGMLESGEIAAMMTASAAPFPKLSILNVSDQMK